MTTSDLVPSVSVENMVNQRAAVLERIGRAVDLIREAATIASAAHLGMPGFTVGIGYGRTTADRSLAGSRVMPNRDGSTFDREATERDGSRPGGVLQLQLLHHADWSLFRSGHVQDAALK